MKVKQYSPYVISFDIVAKGNLKQKSKLSREWDALGPFEKCNAPKIVNRKVTATKKKAMHSSVQYETNTLLNNQ
jgi:hypothetical protein